MAEKISLRIDNGTRIIEVNDNGDTITLMLGDKTFTEKLGDLFKMLLDKAPKSEEDASIGEEIRLDMIEGLKELFDGDCITKIFGNVEPSVWLLTEFFYQIMPYVEDYSQKRDKIISQKYNPNRKGQA